ncbi:MAG: ribonuclease HI [Gemmatimonadetes bacterium]|nr:ribonuclease HI [Gemmatimonadota bacterium]MBL0178627.1 ribonuclease HI [Gemmatimonadota bacterium]
MAIVHLDESCLGNGKPGDNPGGAGGLVEIRTSAGLQRREFYLHSKATTNNRMALASAIAALQLLGQKKNRLRLLVISDSEYLVKGIREWAPAWKARGWVRKGGGIENLELWRALWQSLDLHDVQFIWVRGHAGHPKNEYANDLAIAAATKQITSDGIIESGYDAWLEGKHAARQYLGYDPDATFAALEARLAAGERFPIKEVGA